MGSYSEIAYEVDGDVGVITLDRPEVRNALTMTTYAELADAVESTEARCLVITGRDPAFCSGDDVKQVLVEVAAHASSGRTGEPRLTPAARSLLHTDVPIIAAVNGAAVGWGMELALLADLRVCSDRAKFGELFVKRGLCCDVAGMSRLAQAVGREAAADLLFTGRVIDAQEARELGLTRRVVPHEELMPTAMTLAREIASNPPLAVQRIKAGLRQALDPDWEELGRWVTASFMELFRTEDHKEGVAAFLERRAPRYVGR
jgi:enoyl-CoA hydratase